MKRERKRERLTITIAAERSGLPVHVVQYLVECELLSDTLDENDLRELRRARRLLEMEVNPAGIEVILRMRRRLVQLQAEAARLQAERTWRQLERWARRQLPHRDG